MEYNENPSSPQEPLRGAFSTLAKVGNTVRRRTGPWTPAVHALLRHLEKVGFDGAPRLLGIDAQGREILTHIPGDVYRTASPDIATRRALVEVGRLLRRYHEAVSGFSLPPGIGWYWGSDPGPGSVVCHNDLAPRNTVFRGGSPVAFVDFDLASPGGSCRSPTTRVADATGGVHCPTVRTGCASCAMATGSRSKCGSDSRSYWLDVSKRPLQASKHWPPRACRLTADGSRGVYLPSFAPTEIGSSGTARCCGRHYLGLENFLELRLGEVRSIIPFPTRMNEENGTAVKSVI